MMFIFLLTLGIFRPVASVLDDHLADQGCRDSSSLCHSLSALCASNAMIQNHCTKTCERCSRQSRLLQPIKCEYHHLGCVTLLKYCSLNYAQRSDCIKNCNQKKRLIVKIGEEMVKIDYPQLCAAVKEKTSKDCKDTSRICTNLRRDCRADSRVKLMCPKTCGVCPVKEKNEKKEEEVGDYQESASEAGPGDTDDDYDSNEKPKSPELECPYRGCGNGICLDRYSCRCSPGWTGSRCNQKEKNTYVQDCKDKWSECKMLEPYCEEENIKQNCPKTCGVCGEGCKDDSSNCNAAKHYCELYAVYRKNCAKTCGLCGKAKHKASHHRQTPARPARPIAINESAKDKASHQRQTPARPAEPNAINKGDCVDAGGTARCSKNKDLCLKEGGISYGFRLNCQKTCGICGQVLTTTAKPSIYAKPNGKNSVGGSSCQCGLPNDEMNGQRIVGGTEVKQHLYPWQVALKMKRSRTASCGGTLINEKWVFSAAHCYMESNNDVNNYACWISEQEYIATIGEHDQRSNRDNAPYYENIPVKRHVEHPKFDCYKFSYDFALLELEKPVKFGKYEDIRLLPICLPADDSMSYSGELAIVSGWGVTTEGGRISEKLQEVKQGVADENCDGYREVKITPDKLCAGASQRGMDACQGDSGGPLFLADYRGYTQIGVVSSGIGCARDGKPGIYARITKALDWINKITNNDDGYCMRN